MYVISREKSSVEVINSKSVVGKKRVNRGVIEFIKEGVEVNAVGKIKDTTHHLYYDG